MKKDISIRITGTAGSGIFTVGELISKIFKNLNYNVFYSNEFPSVIKGGHNVAMVRANSKDVNSEAEICDILICMNENMIESDILNLKEGGVVIVSNKSEFESETFKVLKVECHPIFKNMSFFSCVSQVLGVNFDDVSKIVYDKFKHKSDEIINSNLDIIRSVWDSEFDIGLNFEKQEELGEKKIFVDGNSALAIGALKAGVGFVGEYPITPSTSILHYLMKRKDQFKIKVRQTEDEIASIMSVIGASNVGARAMTATSGAGLSLMCEGLGMAAVSETGLVLFNVQRAGASTGLPTYTGQADLSLAVNISHGDNSYVVLAPGDANESFLMSFEAFNIADKYQVPVIVLTDKFLADSKKTVYLDDSELKIDRGKTVLSESELPLDYKRYKFATDDISHRVIPSVSGSMSVSSSYEHDESGFSCESSENTSMMVDKRVNKLNGLDSDFCMPNFYGDLSADLTLICWGSTKGVCLDVINELGGKVNLVHFNVLSPIAPETSKFLKQFSNLMLIEGNKSGQLGEILSGKFGVEFVSKFLKYDGRSFKFEEVLEKVSEVLGGNEK